MARRVFVPSARESTVTTREGAKEAPLLLLRAQVHTLRARLREATLPCRPEDAGLDGAMLNLGDDRAPVGPAPPSPSPGEAVRARARAPKR